MQIIELPDTLQERVGCLIRPIIGPGHDAERGNGSATADVANGWEAVLARLAAWKSDPQEVEDDGVIMPPDGILATAEDVARSLRNQGIDPPDHVLTNGDGGVVFRWRLAGRTWSVEIDVDGSIESSLMSGSRLLWRHSIHDPAMAAP